MTDETENAVPAEFADSDERGAAPELPRAAPRPPQPQREPRKPLEFGGGHIGGLKLSSIDDVYRLARGVAQAGWAPKHYLCNPKQPSDGFDVDKIALGMIFGMEIGFSPMSSLRSVAVINGMPTVWGDGVLGLCQSTGLMDEFTEEPIIADADGAGYKKGVVIGYTCTVVRRGQPKPYVAKFTRDDAKQAKLLEKSGPWTDYPARMYQMRARSWALRAAFADRLNNLMMAEEAMDVVEGSYVETQARQIENKPNVNVASALDAFASKKDVVGVEEKKATNV